MKKFIKKYNVKYNNNNLKKYNKRKFNLYFKLLFLLPNIKIVIILKLIKIINKLPYLEKKNLIIKIHKKFKRFYRNYLINFVKKFNNRKFKTNKVTYKILGTFLYLEINRKNKKGIIYLKYNKYQKGVKFKYYDSVFFNQNLKDFSLYKSFFLKNNKIKWDLSKLTRKSFGKANKYKYAYKSIIVWPFIITIKPFIIIIKNIFFKPFFIFKTWFLGKFSKKKISRNELYSQLYSQLYKIIIERIKQKNLSEDIKEVGSSFFWFILQKYYYSVNNINNIFVNNYYLSLNNVSYNNIFIRNFKKYNKNFPKKIINDYIKIKKSKKNFYDFYNFFKKYLKISFIGLSFFLRLYCLYFFWFLYYINKILYYINRILFNYWLRFFYFTNNITSILNNNFFISFKVLYKNKKKNYYLYSIELENNFYNYLLNVVDIIYWNFHYLIKISINNNFYNNYYLLLFLYYFRNYFYNNTFLNYNILFSNSLKLKNYYYNNNFFDFIYLNNYKYNNIYKLECFIIIQQMYKKYPNYYKVNNNKLIELDNDEKKNYYNLIDKRNKTILLK